MLDTISKMKLRKIPNKCLKINDLNYGSVLFHLKRGCYYAIRPSCLRTVPYDVSFTTSWGTKIEWHVATLSDFINCLKEVP